MIDKLLNSNTRLSYRRLLAFGTSTALLMSDKITSDQWVYIAIAFIAGEAVPKAASAFSSKPLGAP